MKIALLILAAINGGFMLLDGVYVILKGKYIGPEKPGPWAALIGAAGINVFKLGPVFIIFGIAWLAFAAAFWANTAWSRPFGFILSVMTLWYLPFGTLISIAALAILVLSKPEPL